MLFALGASFRRMLVRLLACALIYPFFLNDRPSPTVHSL